MTNLYLVLCTTSSEKRTLAKVLNQPELSVNRVSQAVHVFRAMIKRMMPTKDLEHARCKDEERSKTLDVIHKVSPIFYLIKNRKN